MKKTKSTKINLREALKAASAAAQAAGKLMRQNFRSAKVVNDALRYDIKLELDVRCQALTEKMLLKAFPQTAVFGEEGVSGDQSAEYRWVIDPIDGTVNFAHDIPHACVSIAFQKRIESDSPFPHEHYETLVGVIYDPFVDEIFTAIKGQKARLNGKPISASRKTKLSQCLMTMGSAKHKRNLDEMMPVFAEFSYRVLKMRMMGSAALGVAYVAAGRLDAYLEGEVRIWDIAAGGLILECAGGDFHREPLSKKEPTYSLMATNGPIRKPIEKLLAKVRGK